MGEHPGMTLRGPVDFVITNVPAPVLDFFTGAFFYRLRGRAKNVKYNHIICIPRHEDLDAIAALVVAGKVKVVIDQVVPFDRAATRTCAWTLERPWAKSSCRSRRRRRRRRRNKRAV